MSELKSDPTAKMVYWVNVHYEVYCGAEIATYKDWVIVLSGETPMIKTKKEIYQTRKAAQMGVIQSLSNTIANLTAKLSKYTAEASDG